jgi:hypothetical protein
MNDHKHAHHSHEGDGDKVHRDQRPYWKRAHRDWRFLIAVFLMLVCMIIYLMSNDLAGRRPTQPPQPISGAPGM